jgi:hypothetical protein
MSKKNRVFIGDFIETTDKFFPSVNGVGGATKRQGLKGIVLFKWKDDLYGIRFGKHEWTNHLNGALSDSCGYFLKREEFNLIK